MMITSESRNFRFLPRYYAHFIIFAWHPIQYILIIANKLA